MIKATSLRIVGGTIRDIPSDEMLDRAASALGIVLPPSYRAFARAYGAGVTEGFFIIYVPLGGEQEGQGDDLVLRSRQLANEIQRAVDGGYMRYEPDGSSDVARRLVPFAVSENGDRLAWDPKDPSSGAGELWVYVVDEHTRGMRKVSPTLFDLLDRAVLPRTGGLLTHASFSLDPIFEPCLRG